MGANGQIGWELRETLAHIGDVIALDRKALDLTNSDTIRQVIRKLTPAVIVNAAAYTNVDQAETEPEQAMNINGFAPGIIAEEAKRIGAILVHYSTDYVFDGEKSSPYVETDPPNPINVYGRSKLAGERAIEACGCDFLILRTSWIYGLRRENFLLTVTRAIENGYQIEVVNDQIGVPNWSRFVAETTAKIVTSIAINPERVGETYHLSAAGSVSWFGFAEAIFRYFETNEKFAFPRAISSENYSRITARPKNSILDASKLSRAFNIDIPNWEWCLNRCLDRYCASIDHVP